MSGGGKGGSQTQTTEMTIPSYLEEPIKRNIARAEEIASFGYAPYSGPVVAAMTPMQEAAMRNVSSAAEAYGLESAAGQEIAPQPQTFAGGVRGYSAMPLYEQALAELEARAPGQYAAMTNYFIDPVTGKGGFTPPLPPAPVVAQNEPTAVARSSNYGGPQPNIGESRGVGYAGLRDMFDGGGPQSSTIGGRDFEGPNMDGTAGHDGSRGGFGGGSRGGK